MQELKNIHLNNIDFLNLKLMMKYFFLKSYFELFIELFSSHFKSQI